MYKVLIVEDEMLVRFGLKNSIDWERYGMTVAGDVSNGKVALDFYLKNKPDIIITDIKMPVMDGMELIAKIREKDDKTKIIILSCLEEFELVRKAMSLDVSDYILKLTMTEDEIGTILSKIQKEMKDQEKLSERDAPGSSNIDVVKDRLLKDYMFYRLHSTEEFTRRIQALGLSLHPLHMILAVMEIDRYDKLKALFKDDKGYLANYALMNVINEILGRYAKGVVFYDEGPRYILVFNCDHVTGESGIHDKIISILENIKDSLNIYFNTSVSFGLSSMHSGFELLEPMYAEAVDALEMKFLRGSGIYGRNEKTDNRTLLMEKYELLYRLYDLLGIQDDGYKREFEKKVRSMLDNMPDKKEKAKDVLYQFLHWISDNIHFSGDEIYGMVISYGEAIRRAETLDEAIDCIRDFILTVRNSLRAKNIVSVEVSKALEFMQANFAREISLQDVAEHVALSPSYFSSLFKKELQVNFIECLNDIRIEKAKKLLRETCMKSYEVAEKVGFKESTYFSMLFKKATGVSPNRFRQVWQKAWKEEADD